MTIITTIEDLRVLAKRRVPRMFYDYADAGSWTESTYRANTEDFAKIKFRQRVAVNLEDSTLASTMVGQHARGAGADRTDWHAACRRRDPRRQGRRKIRRAVHLVDHEHLLDRRYRRQHQPAILVPAVCDEGPRVHQPPDRPRQGCALFGA